MNMINIKTPKAIKSFKDINYEFDADDGILWVYLDGYPRPCVTPQLVDDVRSLHHLIEVNDGYLPIKGEFEKVKYHVLDCHTPGVFSLGGDLSFFLDCLKRQDKEAMSKYAEDCQFQSAHRDNFPGSM